MAHSTKAAVFEQVGCPLTLEELELESPRAGEVLVRLGASGVCHSDLHVIDGEWEVPVPLVLGHEGAGVVEAIGEGVRDVSVGNRVVLSWFYPCRRCRYCASGRGWACTGTRSSDCVLDDGTPPFRRASGESVYSYLTVGSFAGLTLVPEAGAIPVADEVPYEVGALIGCGVTTGVGAVVNNAEVPAGAATVVVGCGGVGLSVVMGAKLAGADPIVAVDLADEKLELARELGATHTVRADGDWVAQARSITGGGADFAFEAIGLVETVERLPDLLANGGTGVLVGLTATGVRASFDVLSFAESGKRLIGSNYGGSIPSVDFPRIAQLFLAGALPLDKLITHRIALEELEDAFAAMRRRERARSVIVY